MARSLDKSRLTLMHIGMSLYKHIFPHEFQPPILSDSWHR